MRHFNFIPASCCSACAFARRGLLLAVLLGLGACGGGGGGSDGQSAKLSWRTAALLETSDYGDAQNVRVATNSSGQTAAVWEQVDATATMSIYGRVYDPASGWGTVTQLEIGNQVAGNAAVGIDGSGRAIAVWSQHDGIRYNIWYCRYVPGSGWTGASLLEGDNLGDAEHPVIAMNAAGQAMAAWRQDEGTYFNIKARRYVPGSGWGVVALIELEELGHAGLPQVSMDGNGNAIVVWRQNDGSSYNVWANRYDINAGWDMAQKLDGLSGDAADVSIAQHSGGNALVTWRQEYNGDDVILGNLYRPGSNWSGVSPVSGVATGDSYSPRAAFWGANQFAVMWYQHDGTRTNIMANRIEGGLGSLVLVENDNAGNAYSPQIGFAADGLGVATWAQSDGIRNNIWASTLSPSGSWGTPALIETDNLGQASEPQLGVAADGRAVAVWTQSDGVRSNVWFNLRN